MAERTTYLYEVLIRFNADGYQGSHVIDIERITEGGEVLVEREGPARPITEAEIGPLIGAQNAALIEAVDSARTDAAAHDAARGEAEAKVADAEAASIARAETAETAAAEKITAAEAVCAAQVAEANTARQQAESALENATAALRQALGAIAPDKPV